jgi:hypothetical protein
MFAKISSRDICFAAKVNTDDVLFVTLMEEVGQDGKVLKIFHRRYAKNRKTSEVRRGYPDGGEDYSELGRFCKRWSPWNGYHVDSKRYYEIRSELDNLKKSLYVPFTDLEVGLDAALFCSTVGGLKVLKLVQHKAYAIKWDTDGASLKECGLPSSVTVPYVKDVEEVGDWLTGVYGYCHDGFKTNFETI